MALSSRAHAFSVDVLVGNSGKRKLLDLEEEERSSEKAAGKVVFGKNQAPEKKSKGETAGSLPEETREGAGAIQVDLQGSELWKRFHEIGTEMIITKAGRRMFPSVRVKVKGLDPMKQYYIAIDVVPVDSKRYRYVYHSSQWMVAGNTDHSCITPRLYIHPDSPCSGETWMRQIISFDRVKLTNNEMDDKGHIILQSMHKYKPRVHVIAQDSRFDLSQIQSLPAAGVQTFSFKETEFTTVTAYQNQQITKLKIDRNPFAKGFRDPGRNSETALHPVYKLVGCKGFCMVVPWTKSSVSPPHHSPSTELHSFSSFCNAPEVSHPVQLSHLYSPLTKRGVLDGLLESYPWRPSLTLDFKSFGPESQGGSPGSSPLTPPGGTPSPLSSLLSPSCSPPTLHLSASNLRMSCPESYLHHFGLPVCYKICPTSLLRQPSLIFPSHPKLGNASSPPLLPHFMVEMPALSSLSITNVKSGKAEDLNGPSPQAPNSTGHMLYGLHASGNIFPSSPITQEALNCALHPPYGFYSYNFSMPSRLMNTTGHFKVNDDVSSPLRESRCNHSPWPPAINHCL